MAFHVIFPTAGLGRKASARAVAAGPQWVATPAAYPTLLAEAGFASTQETDVTAEFRETAAAWLKETLASADGLAKLLGFEEYRRSVAERRDMLAAIDDGLLRRALFTAEVET